MFKWFWRNQSKYTIKLMGEKATNVHYVHHNLNSNERRSNSANEMQDDVHSRFMLVIFPLHLSNLIETKLMSGFGLSLVHCIICN